MTDNIVELEESRRRQQTQAPEDDCRPVIRITGGQLQQEVDQAEAALIRLDDGLYRQGPRIVRALWDEIKTQGSGAGKLLRLSEVTESHLIERFTAAARFERWSVREKEWVVTNCPRGIAEVYLARNGDWKLPPLLGVATAPTLRPDGTVLDTPGYDAASYLVFDPCGVEFPAVPESPTMDEALRALALLKEPIKAFPFVGAEDWSVMLSAIITTVIRRSLPVAPMHAFTAPTAGTGKSMLVDVASVIATGERAASTSLGRDKYGDTELEKRVTASMLGGDLIISLDNIKSVLAGDFLCMLLTQELAKLRPLGKSVNIIVPNASAFFANGNNLIIDDDLTRRVLMASLDAGVAEPEQRAFEFSAVNYAKTHRAELVVAALTIVRAFIVSGADQQKTPLGGYDDWSRLVRDPLLWLGEADPVMTIEMTRKDDPTLIKLRAVMGEWVAVFGTKNEVRVSDLIAAAGKAAPPTDQGDESQNAYAHPDLREALLAVADDRRGNIDPKMLGWWLRKHKGRPVRLSEEDTAGHRLFKSDDVFKYARWSVVDLGAVDLNDLTGSQPWESV